MKIYTALQIGEYHLDHCEDFLTVQEMGSGKICCAVMDGCTNDSGTIPHTMKKGTISILGTVDLPIILAGFLFIELVWEQQSST